MYIYIYIYMYIYIYIYIYIHIQTSYNLAAAMVRNCSVQLHEHLQVKFQYC